jgi:hypothetical protein
MGAKDEDVLVKSEDAFADWDFLRGTELDWIISLCALGR